jgi:hypothetical protein|nr:MAG TPA: hypothetical protein [Caudoviricetes sp.]
MKIYVSRKDETVKVKLVEYNERFKTYMVEFITGDRTGKTTSFSASTIKRWWKLVKEVQEELDNDIKEDINYTESELTDEEYARIGLEIAEQSKKKVSSHKLVPMPGIEKLKELKNEVELESVITKLREAGFTVNVVKGLSKTLSIKTVGQLAISKNGFRLKANLNFEFTSDTSYETTKNYNKVMCQTLEDVLKIIQ